MDAAEDISTRIAHTHRPGRGRQKKAREELVAGRITRYLEQFQAG